MPPCAMDIIKDRPNPYWTPGFVKSTTCKVGPEKDKILDLDESDFCPKNSPGSSSKDQTTGFVKSTTSKVGLDQMIGRNIYIEKDEGNFGFALVTSINSETKTIGCMISKHIPGNDIRNIFY